MTTVVDKNTGANSTRESGIERLSKKFDRNIGGNSTTARWGFIALLIALILYLTSIVIYFWPSATAKGLLGVDVIIVIITSLVVYYWWKHRLIDDISKQIQDIRTCIDNIDIKIDEIRDMTESEQHRED